MAKRKRSLQDELEPFDWADFSGGLDQGTPPYKMDPKYSPSLSNVILDDRPGVLQKRPGFGVDGVATTGTTDSLFSYRKSSGTEVLMRSFHTGSMTLIEARNSSGGWAECGYTGAGAIGTVTTNTLWTETSAHAHDFDDWIKIGDTIIFSNDTATYRAVTAVSATTITVGGGGLTDAVSLTFKVRKNLGSGAFVEWEAYKDHAFFVSGTSNFLMCYNGTDIFENPNTWIAGAPAFDTTLEDCPKGEQIAVWNERMFIANVADSGGDGDSLLRYSATSYEPANDDDGEVWNALNEEPIFLNDGSVIRKLLPRTDSLWIWKEQKICTLSGATPDDWVLRNIAGAQGTRYGRLCKVIPSGPYKGYLFWLGLTDFWALLPGSPFPIAIGSHLLRDLFPTISQSIWNPSSKVWTSTADFAAGTNNNVDLTTTANAIRFLVDADTDTTKAQFDAGTQSPASSLDTAKIVDSVLLSEHGSTYYVSNYILSGGSDRKMPDGSVTIRATTFRTPNYRLLYPRVKIQLKKVDAAGLGGTVTAALYDVDGSGKPQTLLETSATTYLSTALDVAYAQKTFEFTITLNPNKSYALVVSGPTGDANNYVSWMSGGSLANGDRYQYDTSWHKQGDDHDIQIMHYLTTGIITSATVDTGTASPVWGTFLATTTLNGQTIAFETSSGAADPPVGAWTAATSGSVIASASARYIRWRATFTTTSPGDTPKLDSASVRWGEAGNWVSAIADTGSATAVNLWGAFNVTHALGTGGAVAYQIAFSSTSPVDGVGAGTGAAILYQTIVPGQAITSLTNIPATTDRYFIVKASLSSTDPVNGIPEVYDMTVNWTQGTAPTELPVATVFLDRIYLSLGITGTSYPSYGLMYDRNGAWVPITYPFNVSGLEVFRDNLYIASQATSAISFASSTTPSYVDGTTAITASLQSTDFDMGARDVQKNFYKFVVSAERQTPGNVISVAYAIDADIDAGTWTTISITQTGTGELNEHVPFPFGTKGKRIAYRVQQGTADVPLALTRIRTYYDLLPDVMVTD